MSEEEMKALVEMKDMLKVENTKLKQENNELLKYKNAWEELKLIINAVAFDKVRTTMRELEQKNGIEVSKE